LTSIAEQFVEQKVDICAMLNHLFFGKSEDLFQKQTLNLSRNYDFLFTFHVLFSDLPIVQP